MKKYFYVSLIITILWTVLSFFDTKAEKRLSFQNITTLF